MILRLFLLFCDLINKTMGNFHFQPSGEIEIRFILLPDKKFLKHARKKKVFKTTIVKKLAVRHWRIVIPGMWETTKGIWAAPACHPARAFGSQCRDGEPKQSLLNSLRWPDAARSPERPVRDTKRCLHREQALETCRGPVIRRIIISTCKKTTEGCRKNYLKILEVAAPSIHIQLETAHLHNWTQPISASQTGNIRDLRGIQHSNQEGLDSIMEKPALDWALFWTHQKILKNKTQKNQVVSGYSNASQKIDQDYLQGYKNIQDPTR